MAILYPLSLPTSIGIAQINLRAANVVALAQSPFTFRQQVFKHPGERWEATVTLPSQRKDLIEPWVAFLLALKGQTGTFLLGDPNNTVPQGVVGGLSATIRINGSVASGSTSLPLKGLPNNVSNLLVAGDYLQLGSSVTATLHKVLLPVSSDGSGLATAEVWPAMRRAVADEELVVYLNAVGRFRLAENTSEWTKHDRSAYALSFNAVEAVT
jgi:hypothetical protein